jgi:hypothetical protein
LVSRKGEAGRPIEPKKPIRQIEPIKRIKPTELFFGVQVDTMNKWNIISG